MSDVQSTPESPQGASVPAGQQKGTNPLRLIILLSVFGVALAGLLYDYCIARPGLSKADKTIKGLLDGSIKDPDGDGIVTDTEVQTMIGRAPSNPDFRKLPNGKIEVYSWRSGLPYRTYDLFVVYTGRKLPLLYSASANVEPGPDQLPPVTKPVKPMTQEEIDNFVPLQPMGGGFGTGGSKGGKGGKAGKRPKKGAGEGATVPVETKQKGAGGPPLPPEEKAGDAGKEGKPAEPAAGAGAKKDAGATPESKKQETAAGKKEAPPTENKEASQKKSGGGTDSQGAS